MQVPCYTKHLHKLQTDGTPCADDRWKRTRRLGLIFEQQRRHSAQRTKTIGKRAELTVSTVQMSGLENSYGAEADCLLSRYSHSPSGLALHKSNVL